MVQNFSPILPPMIASYPRISFDNTENAFAPKSDKQLKKSAFLFSSMGYSWLVKIGTQITPWAIRVGMPIKGIIRNTIFDQFCGGETLEETAKVAKVLGQYHVQAILDYGVEGKEGEENFDHAKEEFIKVINYAATQPNIPFMSVKVTGFARFALLEKLDTTMHTGKGTLMKKYTYALEQLSAEEKAEWQRVIDRMQAICTAGMQRKVGVF